MTVPHWNDFRQGYEYLDNPLEDCSCPGCTRGRAELWGEESNDGSTLYDRGARTEHEPKGAQGWANLREGTGHNTQYYDDGYHLSRDTDGQGDNKVHWTKQDVAKGKRTFDKRHRPPSDSR